MKKFTFVTVLDSNYIQYGISLYLSLQQNMSSNNYEFHIICIDKLAYNLLSKLNLQYVIIHKLSDIESSDIKIARNNRNYVEFCWTLASFSLNYVLNVLKHDYVIYLDADLFFLNSPENLLNKKADIIITPHDFDDENLHLQVYGKYCVQFIGVKRSEKTSKLIQIWYSNVIDWCYCKLENNKFGDQKYLDNWVNEYHEITFLETTGKTLGPWNIKKYLNSLDEAICYHFHSSKIIGKFFIPCDGYNIKNNMIFLSYKNTLKNARRLITKENAEISKKKYSLRNKLGIIKRFILRKIIIMII